MKPNRACGHCGTEFRTEDGLLRHACSKHGDPVKATGIGRTGIQVKEFEDGAMGIIDTTTKQAMHFPPDQALQLREFIRLFDQHAAPVTLLTEAQDIVYGDREQTHGEPAKNLQAIASMWSPIFGAPVTPQQVCLAMIALKVARAVNQPAHRDHWIDIVGYCALAERVGYVTPKVPA